MCLGYKPTIERFCTSSQSCVLSIDPTFNLGPFYVTPITYRNLLVHKQGHHPVIMGPILIHRTKTFEPFYYFASSLVRLNPKLTEIRSFGTDGEPQLIKAFQVCFPQAVQLRCVNLLKQNVKDKLRSLSIPQNLWKDFLGDIFGQQTGTHYEKGMADLESADLFKKAVAKVEARWNNLEFSSCGNTHKPQFYTWFCQYKVEDIIQCVLPQVRAKAGIVNVTYYK